jgi:hypothetical protein
MSAPRSPRVAFGLQAATCALKAKGGRLRMSDQIDLALVALEQMQGDSAAQAAVVDFISGARVSPVGAGIALQDFLEGWMPAAAPRRPEAALHLFEGERFTSHDWMNRRDCGHGE